MTEQLITTFEILVLFQFKHFLADFPLQVSYMVFRKTSPKWDFVLPLLTHCSVHAAFTLLICLIYAPQYWWLAICDLVIHFIMDRIKSSPNMLGRYNDIGKSSFWWCLGFDQMIHHLTHIAITWIIVVGV